jgi:hypothetical protein
VSNDLELKVMVKRRLMEQGLYSSRRFEKNKSSPKVRNCKTSRDYDTPSSKSK